MAQDALLAPNGDVKIVNGDLKLISGADFIRQQFLIKSRKFKAEWLLDIESGVPYIQEIFQKGIDRRTIENYFRELTLSIPGVIKVESFEFSVIDLATRHVSIAENVLIEGPESITFYFDGTLGPGGSVIEGSATWLSTLGDMRVWFDTTDLSAMSYAPPDLTLRNKAATGSAVSVNEPVLLGVSPLGLKRAVLLDPALNQSLSVSDTPAIRHGDGSLSMFVVFKHLAVTYAPGENLFGLFALTGTDGYYLIMYRVNGTTGDHTVEMNGCVISLNGSAEGSRVLQIDIAADGTVSPKDNGVAVDASDPVTVLHLDGDGYIGGPYFSGYIGEVLVYSGVLSDTVSEQVNDYLITKWSITEIVEAGPGFGFFPFGISAFGL